MPTSKWSKDFTRWAKTYCKVQYLAFGIGEVMPSYEFVINEKFGIEGGIGFVTENYLNQFVQESNFGNTRQVKMGPSFLISSRYYPFKKQITFTAKEK